MSSHVLTESDSYKPSVTSDGLKSVIHQLLIHLPLPPQREYTHGFEIGFHLEGTTLSIGWVGYPANYTIDCVEDVNRMELLDDIFEDNGDLLLRGLWYAFHRILRDLRV